MSNEDKNKEDMEERDPKVKFDETGRVKKAENFIDSFNYAVNGLLEAIKTERNMKFHIFATLLVLLLSLFLDLNKIEMMILIITICFVLMAELMNTSIESVVDLVTDRKYHSKAKKAKDTAAGAVLMAAVNALCIAYLMFEDRILNYESSVLFRLTTSKSHLTFISLALILVLVIILKVLIDKDNGTPFQGGSVSGHAAVSFCLATIICIISNDIFVSVLSYALAFLVSESRVEGRIHTVKEVIIGGLLGLIVPLIIFNLHRIF